MKTKLCKSLLYFNHESIPYLKNEIKFAEDLAKAIESELDLTIRITPVPVSVLPYREDASLIIECGKIRGKLANVASKLIKLLQEDQLSTDSYKVSIRFEEEFSVGKGHSDYIDKILGDIEEVYVDGSFLKAYRKKRNSKIYVFRTSSVPENLRNGNVIIAQALDRFAFIVCEVDEKGEFIQCAYAQETSKEVAAHLEEGNGVVVYEN